MTPKEKANELIEKFKPNVYCYYGSGMLSNTYDDDTAVYYSKQCAIIAVDEILKAIPMYTGNLNQTWKYYNEVKTELEKL